MADSDGQTSLKISEILFYQFTIQEFIIKAIDKFDLFIKLVSF